MHPFRTTKPYKAWRDLAEKWPTWKIRFVRLPAKMEKEILPDEQVILIDENIDPAFGVAEAVGHLDLGHHEAEDGLLSQDEAAAAAWLAKMRLDAKGTRPPEMAEVEEQQEE